MSKTVTILVMAAAMAVAGCGKDKGGDTGKETPPAATKAKADPGTASAPAPAADGRRVAIEVKQTGYVPDRVEAAPGEKLVLVFTRTEDTQCGRYIKVGADPTKTELPLNEPVEIAFTMPESGEAPFMCGMDMMKGVLAVAEK